MASQYVVSLTCWVVLAFMSGLHLTDQANIYPSVSNPVRATKTLPALLKWRYTLGKGETLESLTCGYMDFASQNSIQQYAMVVKAQEGAGKVGAKSFPGLKFPVNFKGRVSVIEDGNEFGMKIYKVRKEDQKYHFWCFLVFSSSGQIQPAIFSKGLTLVVKEPIQPRKITRPRG